MPDSIFREKITGLYFFEGDEIQITGICDGIGLILFIFAIFLFVLIALVALIALFGFAVVGGWLIYKGVKMLKKEGKKLDNMLSLALGVGIIANFIFGRTIFHMLEKESLLYYLYVYLNVLLFYCILITGVYLILSWVNFINIGKKNLSYVVVLGCGLNKRKVTSLLARSINKGKQCDKNSSVEFLIYTMNQCKKLTDKPLLVRFGSGIKIKQKIGKDSGYLSPQFNIFL